jgi:transposase
MISVERWWLCVAPVDMRKNIDGVAMHVIEHFGESPLKRTAYVFFNRNGTRLKALIWDGLGFWLCLKRLDNGRFIWPQSERLCELNASQFAWLTVGLDWKKWDENVPKPVWM